VEDGRVFYPAGGWQAGPHARLQEAFSRCEGFVACTRCEFVETVEALLSGEVTR
jgi:hypothetical protein